MTNPFPYTSKSNLKLAIEELSEEVFYGDDLDSLSVALDTVASAFAIASNADLPDPVTTSSVFQLLVKFGLDNEAISLIETIESTVSLQLYDDTKECEEAVEDANSARSDLYDLLLSFHDMLFKPKVVQI